MLNPPIFTPEQLLFLATHLFDKQAEMYSYNLKLSKRKALLAKLFNSPNFDALLQRSKTLTPATTEPDDIYYQWMMPVGEEGDTTFRPFHPDFYDLPMTDQFSTADDAIEIIKHKKMYMLDPRDLAKATLMKLTCEQIENPFCLLESKFEDSFPITTTETTSISSIEVDMINLPSKSPISTEALKTWIEAEDVLDILEADETNLTIDRSENPAVLWMSACFFVNNNESTSVSFKYSYVNQKLISRCYIQKSAGKHSDHFIGWQFTPDPSNGESSYWDLFNNHRHETLLTKTDLENAYTLMMQMYNRVNKKLL